MMSGMPHAWCPLYITDLGKNNNVNKTLTEFSTILQQILKVAYYMYLWQVLGNFCMIFKIVNTHLVLSINHNSFCMYF